MGFYSSISSFYDRIFPLDEDLVPFISRVLPEEPGKVLDIGCATGALANALGSRPPRTAQWAAGATMAHPPRTRSLDVVGIDLDPGMIRLAKGKYQNTRVSFQIGNMLQLQKMFAPEEFIGIFCFGNTIVHLPDLPSITSMFQQVFGILKPGGIFAGQIIHYDRILRDRLPGLPTIEREGVRFVRKYLRLEGDPRLIFETILTDLESGQEISNLMPLYPLVSSELREALINAGFQDFRLFADTDRTDLAADSFALYFAAEKPNPGNHLYPKRGGRTGVQL